MSFKEEIMTLLEKMKPEGTELREVEVNKVNEGLLHGIVFHSEKHNGGPTVYLEYMQAMHEDGMPTEEIAKTIINMITEAFEEIPTDISELSCGNKIVLLLVDEETNKDFLKDKPAMDVGDGYKFVAKLCDKNSSATINNDMLESFGWDQEMMFDCGIDNMMKNIRLSALSDSLMGDPANHWDNVKLYPVPHILTVNDGHYGAACLYLPGVADNLKEKFGQGFYAIPSSIHEFILMPKSMNMDKEYLQSMCKEANSSVVAKNEVLSDRISEF